MFGSIALAVLAFAALAATLVREWRVDKRFTIVIGLIGLATLAATIIKAVDDARDSKELKERLAVLAPPEKATLVPGLGTQWEIGAQPSRFTKARLVDGVVAVSILVLNVGNVVAQKPTLTVRIPDSYQYTREPPGLQPIEGMPTDRSFEFNRIGPQAFGGVTFSVIPRAGAQGFEVSTRATCDNCALPGDYFSTLKIEIER